MDKIMKFRNKWLIYIIALFAGLPVGYLTDWLMGKDFRIVYWISLNIIVLSIVFIMNKHREAKERKK